MAWTRTKLAEGWGGDLSVVGVDASSQRVEDGSCLSLELHRNRLWPEEFLVAQGVLDDLRRGTPVLIQECEGRPLIDAVRLPFDVFAFLSMHWKKAPGAWPVLRGSLANQGVNELVYWRLDLLQAARPGEPGFRCGFPELLRGDCGPADLLAPYRWIPWAVGAGAALLLLAPALHALAAYYTAQAAREVRSGGWRPSS